LIWPNLRAGPAGGASAAYEIGDPVDAEDHGPAVDDKLTAAEFVCGLDDEGESVGPVVAVAGGNAHALAVALQPHTKAVVFDFVDAIVAARHRLATDRQGKINAVVAILAAIELWMLNQIPPRLTTGR